MGVADRMLLVAYIDPGSGSYLVQFLIASALGVLFAARSWVRSLLQAAVRRILRRKQ